jgi:hypothetical protein
VGLNQTLRRLEQARQERRESGLAELGATLSQLQESLSTNLLENNQTLARQRLATAALAPNIRRLLVADESNRVCLASDSDWLGRSLADHPDYDPGAATAARETRAGRIVPAGLKLLGYFPITLGLNPGEIRPSRAGLCSPNTACAARLRKPGQTPTATPSLSAARSCAFARAGRGAPSAGHAPLEKLAPAVAAVAGGDLTARARIHGRDEIARLAESFDDMTARLAACQAELQQTRNDLANDIDSMPAILATSRRMVASRNGTARPSVSPEIPADRRWAAADGAAARLCAGHRRTAGRARSPTSPRAWIFARSRETAKPNFYDLMLYPLRPRAPPSSASRISPSGRACRR